LLKQTGEEDRPVQYNSEERLLAAGGDISLALLKKKKKSKNKKKKRKEKCGQGGARQRVRE